MRQETKRGRCYQEKEAGAEKGASTHERLHAPCRRSQVSGTSLSATDNHL